MMKKTKNVGLFALTFVLVVTGFGLRDSKAQESKTESASVDFNRDIRPILSDTCFKCHGPDEHDRQGGLRLDTREGLEDSGAVDDGADSEFLYRIFSADESEVMPPADSGRVLTEEQKALLKTWVESGAKWQDHWSLTKPAKQAPPETNNKDWIANPIDQFVLKKLESSGLKPNAEANRNTLIRRVAFDLTGMPADRALMDKYLESDDSNWYEQLVDELIASPRYGEHMGRFWLDAARYGDTHGLHLDNYREMWPYRDWVIKAFNSNKSFKDFTIEQLAGDLLDEPTNDQLIATGFNRSHVTTAEGGSIKEEVYVRNVVDRVSTTGTVFLGLTVGCAQCHDHKFDPVSQKEFYQLFAYFNNLEADPMDGNKREHPPILKIKTSEEDARIAELESALAASKKEIVDFIAAFEYEEPEPVSNAPAERRDYVWIEDAPPQGVNVQGNWNYTTIADGPVFKGDKSTFEKAAPDQLLQHFFDKATSPLRVTKGDVFFTYVYLDPDDLPQEIMLQWNDGNWSYRAYWGENKIDWGNDNTASRMRIGDLPEPGKWVRLEIPVEKVGFNKLSEIRGWAFTQMGGSVYWDHAGVTTALTQSATQNSFQGWLSDAKATKGNGLPGPIKNLVNQEKDLEGEQSKKLLNHFLENVNPESVAGIKEFVATRDKTQKELNDFRNKLPLTYIWKEKQDPKKAFMLLRGEYDQKGDEVQRQTPQALHEFKSDWPQDRLGLAYWIVDPDNPLTVRVTVNRFWQQLFGTGIVETSEDFGAQGTWPSHPELLDWLAIDFVESGWDVKRFMKQLVMSSSYRQSSNVTAEKYTSDPGNRLLARGPRFRLDAEALRDQALSVSGLLVEKLGGPSVKPPQPDGLWFAVGYSGSNTVRFAKDSGAEKVHRRSVYTFWKRTSPPPQMNTFDAPSRESCTVRRERTNTPLQALMLMNDPQYVECARNLAQRILDFEGGDEAKVNFMIREALGRNVTSSESQLVLATLAENRTEFKSNADAAKKVVVVGETPAPESYDPIELASWTMVANLIMNMDEFVTKN